MNDLGAAPRTRLITAFGTMIYFDATAGELRHGPIESSPPNALYVADRRSSGSHCQGSLVHESGDRRDLIVCLGERCGSISTSEGTNGATTPTVLELIPLERGLIAFKADGLFLSAFPDGRVAVSAPLCSTWELFLATEDWCTDTPESSNNSTPIDPKSGFDRKRIKNYIIHPTIRAEANRTPKAKKILIYGYTKWSHGRVYYDLCKKLHEKGYIVDILDWQVNHQSYIAKILPYYDLVMSALDGIQTLVDSYQVPYDKIIALSHHELDIRMLVEQKGMEVFDKFANYGVVSEFVYCASLMRGVARVPMVASLGIDYAEFRADISERLITVGYGSSMSTKTYGIEWKRGELAEAAVRAAGLAFRVAGSTGNQTSFHDMPDFYRSIDAVVTSSISEAAQLPVMEAAAAGRLVIGTPVGHFPRKAYEGGGIIAPIEAEKFKAFTAETLRLYKNDRRLYVEKCHEIQNSARMFDWKYVIGEWIALIENADSSAIRQIQPTPRADRALGRNSDPADLADITRLDRSTSGAIVGGRKINSFVYDECLERNVRYPTLPVYLEEAFGQCGEDLIVLSLLRAMALREGLILADEKYLEIGGNHPIATSATYLLSEKLGMSGVIVEANPALVEDLQRIRVRDVIVNAAVQDQDIDVVSLSISNADELSSLDRSFVQNWDHGKMGERETIGVPAVRINNLIESHFSKTPIFVSIDIEGLDLKVLRDMDFGRFRPAIIQAEPSNHHSPGNSSLIQEFMNSVDYLLVASTDVNMIFADRRRATKAGNSWNAERPIGQSFDLFDTLVARRCVEPHEIFRIVEQRAKYAGFAEARIMAEAEISGSSYVLRDIYQRLIAGHGMTFDAAERLMELELATEEEQLFPIAETCSSFGADDVVVSDMYLPEEFLRRIINEKCNLSPRRLFLSSHGKRTGVVWSAIRNEMHLTRHTGDNEVTDVASAVASGISAHLSTIAKRSPVEIELSSAGYEWLANLVREARLRTWNSNAELREVQLCQIELNFPMILLATLHLLHLAREKGWRHILFSGRDCYLWDQLYQALWPRLSGAPTGSYFYTSRMARLRPSKSYLEYLAEISDNRPTVIVDVCGTGWSLDRLLQHAPALPIDGFVIHHIDTAEWREEYESFAPVARKANLSSLIRRSVKSDEAEVLEELNRAPHSHVEDVVKNDGQFEPMFSPDTDDYLSNSVLNLHHSAFRVPMSLLENIDTDRLSISDHTVMIAKLYEHMEGKLVSLSHFLARKKDEQAIFWAALSRGD